MDGNFIYIHVFIRISVIANFSKIFMQFPQHAQHETVTINGQQFISSIPGKICMEVYRAIRRRQLRITTNLPVLSTTAGWRRAKALGIEEDAMKNERFVQRRNDDEEMPLETEEPILPTSDVEYIKIQISSRIDVGHFWVQNDDEQTLINLSYIEKQLNRNSLAPITDKLVVGQLYAGEYENKMYYRCRVICVNQIGKEKTLMALVIIFNLHSRVNKFLFTFCLQTDLCYNLNMKTSYFVNKINK